MDYSELDGFQLPCRRRALAEWRQRQEDAEFERLCESLKARNRERKFGAARRYRALLEERRQAPLCSSETICGGRHQCRDKALPGSAFCWVHQRPCVR